MLIHLLQVFQVSRPAQISSDFLIARVWSKFLQHYSSWCLYPVINSQDGLPLFFLYLEGARGQRLR